MNTRYIAEEYRLSHWAQIMGKRIESGLTIKAFCKEAGFHENAYYYWQRKLRAAACEQLALKQPETGLTQTSFAEVKLNDVQKSQTQNTKAVMRGSINIEISGVKITTDSTYPPEQLACLLRELVGQC